MSPAVEWKTVMGILCISFPFILIVCDAACEHKMRKLCVVTNLWNIKNVDVAVLAEITFYRYNAEKVFATAKTL